jgi:hypothetical protein
MWKSRKQDMKESGTKWNQRGTRAQNIRRRAVGAVSLEQLEPQNCLPSFLLPFSAVGCRSLEQGLEAVSTLAWENMMLPCECYRSETQRQIHKLEEEGF